MFKHLLVVAAVTAQQNCNDLVKWEKIATNVEVIAANATSKSSRLWAIFYGQNSPTVNDVEGEDKPAMFYYDDKEWRYPEQMNFGDKEINVTDLSVDNKNLPSFISNKKLYVWYQGRWSKHKSCHLGVCPGATTYQFYSTSCDTKQSWLYDREVSSEEYLEGPETDYIASGAGILYAVGTNDKKLWSYTQTDKKWVDMGLDNVLKVAAGPNQAVYAVVEGNKILKYSKSQGKWVRYGSKRSANKVTLDGRGNLYLQDLNDTVWKTKTSDLLDRQISDCQSTVKPATKPPPTTTPAKKFNPWLREGGTYDLLDPEVKQITDAFYENGSGMNKCPLLSGWHSRKKALLMDGYVQGNEVYKAQNWFDNQAASFGQSLSQQIKQIENNKVFYKMSESDYQDALAKAKDGNGANISKNREEYRYFLSLNNRKEAALKRLATVKCRLGNGSCFPQEAACSALTTFYDYRKAEILRLRHVSESLVRDYQSVTWAPAQVAKAKAEIEQQIQFNNDIMRDEITNIREVYTDQYEANRLIAEKTREFEIENQDFWRQYQQIEQRQQGNLMKVFYYERDLDIKIRDLIEKTSVREAQLLSQLSWQ